ncbi:ArsR/SmtB family transcription factor [Flavitalea flava]
MEERRDVFKAIADPTRREILSLVAKKNQNLNAIAENFDMSRSAVSQHIKILTDCGLILIKKSGRDRYCEPQLQTLNEVTSWIEQFKATWEDRFSLLDTVLKEMQTTPNKQKNEHKRSDNPVSANRKKGRGKKKL